MATYWLRGTFLLTGFAHPDTFTPGRVARGLERAPAMFGIIRPGDGG